MFKWLKIWLAWRRVDFGPLSIHSYYINDITGDRKVECCPKAGHQPIKLGWLLQATGKRALIKHPYLPTRNIKDTN